MNALREWLALELVALALRLAPKHTAGGRLIIAYGHSLLGNYIKQTPVDELVIGNVVYRATRSGDHAGT